MHSAHQAFIHWHLLLVSQNYKIILGFTFPTRFCLTVGVEMVGPKKREMSGIVLNYFYAFGEALVGLFAWLWGDWITVQYAVSAPPLLFALYYWIIPESIRWLLARGETAKAAEIIKKAAKVNRIKLSDNLIKNFSLQPLANGHVNVRELFSTSVAIIIEFINVNSYFSGRIQGCRLRRDAKEEAEIWSMVECEANVQFEENDIAMRHSFLHLVRDLKKKNLSSATLISYRFFRATNAFVFYGLSLNSQNLSGNKYLNFILVCLIEIPGSTVN